MNFTLGVLVGLLVGLVAGVSFASPAFGRAVAKFLAVVLIGLGTAALVWPLAIGETGEPLRGPFGTDVIEYRSEAFAWAGGLLAGGVLTAAFAFLGRAGKPEGPRG
jgi:hypothetical protein